MRIVAILPVRNEDWILGFSLRALLQWVDQVVISLHSCTDRSAEIVEAVMDECAEGRVFPIRDDSQGWDEMAQRQRLLMCARTMGASHIVTLDADEVLTANLVSSIRPLIESLPRGHILNLPGFNLRHGIREYHLNGVWGDRWFSAAFVDSPGLTWSGDQYHSRKPGGNALRDWQPIGQGAGGILHFWGASEARLIAKHRMYKILERLRWPHKPVAEIEYLYNIATCGRPDMSDVPARWRFQPVPAAWLDNYGDLVLELNLGATPWQDAWCDEMILKYGREHFAGLSV